MYDVPEDKIPETMQIKMLKHYRHYEKGHTYYVSAKIGEIILNGFYGYRVD